MKRLAKDATIGPKRISCCRKTISGLHNPHFHDFYEIEYVLCGSGTYNINGNTVPCADGTLFFMTPLDYHSVQTEGAEIFNLMFAEQFVEFGVLEPFLRRSVPKAITVAPALRPFFEQLFTEMVEQEANEEYRAALMRCVLLKLAQLLPETADVNISDTLFKVHAYILYNYRQKINLNTAAAHVGLTPSYLSALFKKEMQVGFKTYVNGLRLEYAKKLLLYTNQPVKQICAESGFDDLPNFIKRFKAYYGATPTALRQGWGSGD